MSTGTRCPRCGTDRNRDELEAGRPCPGCGHVDDSVPTWADRTLTDPGSAAPPSNDRTEATGTHAPRAGPEEGATEAIGEVGDYLLLRELGRGAMGVVYLARHRDLGRRVAVKLLPRQATRSDEVLRRFRREARAAARLRHPNIVPVHGAGEEDGAPWIAMDYVPGRPLSAIMRDEVVSWPRAVRLVAQVARGLAHAHAEGVIHRDIKPSNILVVEEDDGSERALIADFGIARLDRRSTLTKEGAVLGTPFYMSPEQAAGEPIDARTDVFSLASVLYHLVCCRRPFRGTSVRAILDAVRACRPERPRRLRPELPSRLEAAILRGLAQGPDDRFPGAGALAAELEEVRTEHEEGTGRSRPLVRAALVVGLATLLAAAGWLGWRVLQTRRVAAAARTVTGSLAPGGERPLRRRAHDGLEVARRTREAIPGPAAGAVLDRARDAAAGSSGALARVETVRRRLLRAAAGLALARGRPAWVEARADLLHARLPDEAGHLLARARGRAELEVRPVSGLASLVLTGPGRDDSRAIDGDEPLLLAPGDHVLRVERTAGTVDRIPLHLDPGERLVVEPRRVEASPGEGAARVAGARAGWTVVLAPGEHRGPLRIVRPSVTVRGAEGGETPVVEGDEVGVEIRARDARVEALEVRGRRVGLRARGGPAAGIDDVRVHTEGTALRFLGSPDPRVRRLEVTASRGIEADGPVRLESADLRVVEEGVVVRNGPASRLLDTRVRPPGDTEAIHLCGVRLTDSPGARVEGGGVGPVDAVGVLVERSPDAVVRGTTVTGAAAAGILAVESDRVEVERTRVADVPQIGVGLIACRAGRIRENLVVGVLPGDATEGHRGDGIRLMASPDATVEANRIARVYIGIYHGGGRGTTVRGHALSILTSGDRRGIRQPAAVLTRQAEGLRLRGNGTWSPAGNHHLLLSDGESVPDPEGIRMLEADPLPVDRLRELLPDERNPRPDDGGSR